MKQAGAVADEIAGKGHESLAVKTDVSDEQSANALVRGVLDKYRHVDILINNAAVFSTIKMKPVEEISVEEWDGVLNVNLRGTFCAVRPSFHP
jgi:3-oxoacyl-[acyl-carrier protein] reductase